MKLYERIISWLRRPADEHFVSTGEDEDPAEADNTDRLDPNKVSEVRIADEQDPLEIADDAARKHAAARKESRETRRRDEANNDGSGHRTA